MRHKDLKPCPLCGRPAEISREQPGIWNVGCGDGIDTCGLVLFGNKAAKKEMIRRWNTREDRDGEGR